MEIHKLTLDNFRNYEHEEISFCPGTNVIFGDNAQGKTNLLEAVCMFSYGRSKRAKSDSELIRFGERFFRLSMTFSDAVREYEAVMQVGTDGKKTIKINHVAITKLSQLMNYLNVVMFSPAELDIVKGAPSVRRRFLDEAVSQLFPKYFSGLTQYYKILEQKNGLLKTLRTKGVQSDELLSVWNEQLAETGAQIVLKRREFMENLALAAAQVQAQISKEELSVDYLPSVECGGEGAVSVFYEKLQHNQRREIETGAALLGIQRDDIRLRIGGKDARLYASQGQQRTAVLSLKLAQTEYIHEVRGEYPILLLDDIMSELDSYRRRFLAEKIKNKQVLITATDAENREENASARFFEISKGRLV